MVLLKLAAQEHILLLTMHHIICDGWSTGLFHAELSQLYAAFCQGRPSPLTEPPLQYADFAEWQRRWRSYPEIAAQLAYWEEKLHDPLPVMKLTKGRRRKKADDFTTARRQVALRFARSCWWDF